MNQENQSIQIRLFSDSRQSLNNQALNQLTEQLYQEINRLEPRELQLKPKREPPAGAKMIEFAVAANVIIELIPHVVPPIMKLLVDWVNAQKAKKSDVSMNMQIGNKHVTITPSMTEDAILSEIQAATGLLQTYPEEENRYALIIGTSQYEDSQLTKLRAPNADVTELAKVLENQEIGAFNKVTVLLNKSVTELKQAIERFYKNRARNDTLLLYFSGHGVKGDSGNLFLTARNTKRDVLHSTGLSNEFISSMIDGSFSRRKILILDCCYSGAFARGSKSENMIGQRVHDTYAFKGNGFGQVIITASDAMQYAWEGDQVIGDTGQSLFTHYLVEGLKTGKADGDKDGQISLEDLYEYTYQQVAPHQTPSITSTEKQGKLIIAKNPHHTIQPAKLPDELLESIQSGVVWKKEGVISELKQMLTNSDQSLALAAKKQLQLLTQDDSRRVSDAANAALSSIIVDNSHSPPQPTDSPQKPHKETSKTNSFKPQKTKLASPSGRGARYWGSLIVTFFLSFILSFIIAVIGGISVYVGTLMLSPVAGWIIFKAAIKICDTSQDSAFRNLIFGTIILGGSLSLLVEPIGGTIFLVITIGTVHYLFKNELNRPGGTPVE